MTPSKDESTIMPADDIPAPMVLELAQMRLEASWALEREDWLVTQMEMRRVYRYLLRKQEEYGLRFHKGWELHNFGYSRYKMGDSKGVDDITLAYVEDVLSATEGDEDSADRTPAGVFLKSIGFATSLMDAIKEIGRRYKRKGQIPGDPQVVLNDAVNRGATQDQAAQHARELTSRITDTLAAGEKVAQEHLPTKRSLEDLMRIPYEKRCFIGCSYHHGGPALNDIRKFVEECGYEPVVVNDFQLRGSDCIHHDSLLVLNMCPKAIFEVTFPAGQLMELERCRDYDIRPLLLRNAIGMEDPSQSQVSAMIGTMSGTKPVIWLDMDNLKAEIEAYLGGHQERTQETAEPEIRTGPRWTDSAGASPPPVS
jgi:hypothetical protein